MNDASLKKKIIVNGILVGEVEATGDLEKDMKVATDYLKANGYHKDVSTVQAIFRQAMSFSTTASYIYERDLLKSPRNGLGVAPFVVNASFSIELYLKTLFQLNGASVRGHEILALFDGLPQLVKNEIFELGKVHAPKYQMGISQPEELRAFVSELDTAFVDWRYLHEKKKAIKIQIQATILIMHALHEACKNLGARELDI